MNYCVKMSAIESFLSEVERQKPNEVRVEAKSQEVNDGADSVFLVAGFISEALYELQLYCGNNFRKSKQEGTDKFRELLAAIKEKAKELDIPVYEGRIEVF
jgi:hypothetical protein